MKKRCPVCDLNYAPEPGYYYGAMFMSYILTGFLFLSLALLFRLVFHLGLWPTMGLLTVIAGILYVWIFRVARAMYINLNVAYNQNWNKKDK